MMKRYLIYISILAMALTGITSCSDVEFFDSEDEIVSMTYTIGLGDDVQGRAIGDGNNVDRLYVGVYEEGKEVKRIEGNISNREAQITIELFKNRTYNLVFWAQSSQTDVYDLTDLRNISVTYPETMTLKEAGRMDAFFLKENVTVTEMGMNGGELTLKRPFAQLNIAASEEDALESIKRAVLTVQYENEEPLVLTYTDFTVEEGDKVTNNEVDYYYVATAFLKPGIISGNVVLYDDSNKEIKSFDLNQSESLELEANHRYNVLGDMITQEELPGWDGITITAPEQEENRYIIDDEADLAWLSQNDASTLLEGATFVITKKTLNMGNKEIASIQLPAGSTFDGNGNTIRNYANSLFGDATNITVQNLNLDGITASSDSHVGVLVNTLTGTSSFTEVTVTNSSATTSNGAAGGMIGYITNKEGETLKVTFSNCTATDNKVNGLLTSGVYVGRFRGYDNSETLTFSSCDASSTTINGTNPYYIEGNEATWLSSNDYSNYSGWLGCEEYYRGTINYGNERFIPKWDGSTKVTPLTDTGNATIKLIYSAFDLANCAGTNPGSIKFMTDVDMGTEIFEPLTNISKLFGEGKNIYNLKVETNYDTQNANGGGFIRRCTTSTIENITFNNADVKVTHVEGSDGDALASIVCGTAEGNNIMTNVKVVGGKLYGCNKMGGIAGYITGTFKATGCIVDGLSIENYDSGGKDSFGFKAKGEVGGAFGFINAYATISDCYVKNTILNCEGVNNGKILFTKKYAGRHVNEFIGDIRTVSGQTITITYNEANFEGNQYKNREDHYSECKYIGHCYYTNVTVFGQGIKDTKGNVTVNGSSITVVENY